MKDIWQMNKNELLNAYEGKVDRHTERVNLGDVAVVCHTSNQGYLLQQVIDSSKIITDKIIILNDCSQDDTVEIALKNNCIVYNLPEGWIYTHGFGELIKFGAKLCGDTKYHLQIDTGEELVVPLNTEPITGDNVQMLRLNGSARGHTDFRQILACRLFNTELPVVMKAYIHGSPSRFTNHSKITNTQMYLIHHDSRPQNDSQYYKDRKARLYHKLLRKGFVDRRLENNFWYEKYTKEKDYIDKTIARLENTIGVLEETDLQPKLIN